MYIRGFRMRVSIELALERDRVAEPFEVLLGADLVAAEALEVLGAGLRVEQDELALAEAIDESDQRDLAGVALAVEHALPEEHATEAHAVQAARELTPAPRLDAVGVPELVEADVGGDQV